MTLKYKDKCLKCQIDVGVKTFMMYPRNSGNIELVLTFTSLRILITLHGFRAENLSGEPLFCPDQPLK